MGFADTCSTEPLAEELNLRGWTDTYGQDERKEDERGVEEGEVVVGMGAVFIFMLCWECAAGARPS